MAACVVSRNEKEDSVEEAEAETEPEASVTC